MEDRAQLVDGGGVAVSRAGSQAFVFADVYGDVGVERMQLLGEEVVLQRVHPVLFPRPSRLRQEVEPESE